MAFPLLVVLLAGSATVSVAETPGGRAPRMQCPVSGSVVGARKRVRPRRLGDMPPAIALKALWRTDTAGCPQPLSVRAYLDGDQR